MAEKIWGIYKITNTVNGKVYIGQSVNIYKRWERHKLLGTSCNISNPEHKYPLYMAMRKYGIDYFKFEIIDQCSQEDLNNLEEQYIRQYNSDSSSYGYNCRKQCHSTGKLSKDDVQQIYTLLSTTSFTLSEIAGIAQVATTVISKINQGKLHYSENQLYPIRTQEQIRMLTEVNSYLRNATEIDFNKDPALYNIEELYTLYLREYNEKQATCTECGKIITANTKNGLCRKCYDAKISANRGLPEEDVNFSLIERILDTSLESVAKEYGYTSGNAVKKILKNHELPFTHSDMLDYYEQQTGHKHHKVQQKEERKEATRQHNKHYAPRKVAQFDQDSNLVAVYPSTKEATRQSGVDNSSITRCCNGMAWQAGGFLWFYLDQEGNPIHPEDVATHHWNTRCDICGGDTDSLVDDICPRCAENRRSFDKADFTLEQLTDLLNEYPLAQLAKLLSCDPKTIYAWFARYGISREEVRKMNRDRS